MANASGRENGTKPGPTTLIVHGYGEVKP